MTLRSPAYVPDHEAPSFKGDDDMTMTTEPEDKLAHAKAQGQAQFDSIVEMVTELNAADTARAVACERDAEQRWEIAEQAIHEDALSVEVRSDWHIPGALEPRPKNTASCFAPAAQPFGSSANFLSIASPRPRTLKSKTGLRLGRRLGQLTRKTIAATQSRKSYSPMRDAFGLESEMNEDLQHALENLIAAHRILLDGREAQIEFWEQAVSQTCKRIAEAQIAQIKANREFDIHKAILSPYSNELPID